MVEMVEMVGVFGPSPFYAAVRLVCSNRRDKAIIPTIPGIVTLQDS